MNKNLVSVIIPCFNSRKYILETLESISKQGDCIGEIIIIDDASTDDTVDYIKRLDIGNLLLIQSETNQGIAGARNKGIAMVSCPYIAFLDSDDIWIDNMCQNLIKSLNGNSADYIFGSVEHFLSNDYSGSSNYIMPQIQTGYFAGCMMARTEFFKSVGYFDESLQIGEFIDWFNRAIIISKPIIIDDLILKRRIHGNNTSIISNNSNTKDYLKVIRNSINRKKNI